MHDTSTESMSKWRAVGSKRSDSMILTSGISSQIRKQSRPYRPSKQREISNSKIFNRNRSRIESLDNINKDDLNDSQSKINNLRFQQNQSIKERKDSVFQEAKKHQTPRVGSAMNEFESKDATKSAREQQKASNILMERELITLKNDYNKFKQKILSELEIQKNSIIKLVNQILESVKSQLLTIEQKYARNSSSLKKEQSMPIFPNFNEVLSPQSMKLHDISVIKNNSPLILSKNPTEKALISEMTSGVNLQDPITMRFSNFYSAIEKMKSGLDELHEMSTYSQSSNPIKINSPLRGKVGSVNNEISKFLRT